MDSGLKSLKRLTIVGTGLLGGSVGLALKQAGFRGRIVGVARRPETAQQAVAAGCVDEAGCDLAAGVAGSGLILLATPVKSIPQILQQLGRMDLGGTVITDVGSAKEIVVEAAQRCLTHNPQRFVGSHPMAGSEHQGPWAADAGLFAGKPCVLTPLPQTDPAAIALVESLWRSLDMSVLRMTPAEHDRQVAVVSHLPHAAAVLLVLTAAEAGGWEMASTGLASTTRLASSNPPMRMEIAQANRRNLLAALDAFSGQLLTLRRLLEKSDGAPELLQLFEKARQIRDTWLASRGSGSASWEWKDPS